MKIMTRGAMNDNTVDIFSIGYLGYAKWCWHRPVFLGLPLILLVPALMVVDLVSLVLTGLWYLLSRWGKS